MCGIGGIVRTDGQPIPEEWLDAIDARIAYRGPDGAGRFRDRVEFTDEKGEKRVIEVALIHRRLSIIDHTSGGQPMVSERGRTEAEGLVAVVFNGCIYNHRELRRELEARGRRFVTDHSDTEVLIHGWREWGEALPDHLEGMYAYAVWDRTSAQLFLARDQLGEKPLFYRAWLEEPHLPQSPPRGMAFSSDCWALIAIPFTEETPDSATLVHWAVRYAAFGYSGRMSQPYEGDGTIWEIDPGQAIKSDGAKTFHRIARDSLSNPDPAPPNPLPEGEGSLESLLERAVARRLEADVPLGCFLSGGVDSSLIAHFAKKHKPDLMTFTVRMPDPRYDESAHAEAVARHLGTNHRTLDVAMKPAEDLVHLIDLLGQPFGDSSILPAYWVSKAARQHVKVALSGDGGDELFLGYERYMAAPFLARHWRWLRLLPVGFLHGAHPKSRWNKLARLADMARDYPSIGLTAMESIFTQRQLRELIDLPSPSGRGAGGEVVSERDWSVPHQPLPDGRGSLPAGRGSLSAIEALRHFDLNHYLPGDLLRKTDTASMAVALEVRCPFLDRDLARAVLAMPIQQLIPGGERKGLLKQIARKHLPREVVDRPKMGFAIPIGEWFRDDDLPHRGAGMKTLLLDHLNSTEPFGPIQLNPRAVRRLIDEHMTGGFRGRDHSHRLFTLLTLSIWARGVGRAATRG
ncbi:MAG: asparagine synthase (glutamine-hydrolyzing) [Phycisphaeraceae bacterium]|nr:MAG: asparagine synthase (glutamine-hydrolyzing) [Phycisphaeraceae bacterium]